MTMVNHVPFVLLNSQTLYVRCSHFKLVWKQGQNQIAQTEKYNKTVEDNGTEQNRALQFLDICHQEAKRVSDYEPEAIVLVLNYKLFSTLGTNNR